MEPLNAGLNAAGVACRSWHMACHSGSAIYSMEGDPETTYWVLTIGSTRKVVLKVGMVRGKKEQKRQG